MKISIAPSVISGEIQAPASKSSMQRACAAALLAKGKTIIHNPGKSNDDIAALETIKILGAEYYEVHGTLFVESKGINPSNQQLNCGESGLSMRMFSSIAALFDGKLLIDGRGSLLTRPMDFFTDVFPKLNVSIKSNNGKLPLEIRGPIIPKTIEVDGSLSSQFLTGLLFAYSYLNAKEVSVYVKNLNSKPYIDLTLDVLEKFGLKVPENKDYKSFYFSAEDHIVKEAIRHYDVEGDWSGAAFLLVAGATSGSITVKGLDVFSAQADKKIIQALKDSGCILDIDTSRISVKSSCLKSFVFDATDCPDLFPPLVALAAFCTGKSIIKGVSRLEHKESNRAQTLKDEFYKLGVVIEFYDDIMVVYGGGPINGAEVHSHHDHRIAMACAIVALKANSEVVINEAQAVSKSYPDFFDHLKQLGVKIKNHNPHLNLV
jgi:3-phosphoshikimate 1-carboxyvinyltransferase